MIKTTLMEKKKMKSEEDRWKEWYLANNYQKLPIISYKEEAERDNEKERVW